MAVLSRVGLDIGGTFTDAALEIGESRYTAKVLTTPKAPELGAMQALESILRVSGVKAGDVGEMIHGTTLATNALISRAGARTALITTDGFRDTLEIGTEGRPDQYDLRVIKPEPIVPRRHRFAVQERMDSSGRVLVPLESREIRALIPILKDAGIESVAVGFLHSYVNSAHERQVREILLDAWPELMVTLSGEVSPEFREYERISTACANAYVQPLIARYLERFEALRREHGVGCEMLLMLSSGGLTTVDTAIRFPVRLVESGPAGGAIFAGAVAQRCGLSNVVSFDMGGTTAKICMIEDGQAQTSRSFEVARVYRFKKGSGLPLRIPVVEMVEIGAGGGSISRLDAMGRITVGPDSASSDPGPACYGRGGKQPTVTDADLVMGRLDPKAFAGGDFDLSLDAALAVMTQDLATPLGMDATGAAFGISEMVDESMSSATRVHAIESGKTLESRSLIAFGGAAPLHAARMAEKLGISHVVIPAAAGVGSAVGFLRAPIAYEVNRTLYQRLSQFNPDLVNTTLDEMESEAGAIVGKATQRPTLTLRRAYMRYVGQGHELLVELPEGAFDHASAELLRERFDKEYERVYGRSLSGWLTDVEIANWSVTVTTEAYPDKVRQQIDSAKVVDDVVRERMVFDPGSHEHRKHSVLQRKRLTAKARVEGPAIVVEDDTSTVISPSFNARMNEFGDIELEVKRKQA